MGEEDIKGITAIIKPTHECNLACKYCYIEDSIKQGKMNFKTLKNTIQQLLNLTKRDRINFIWHGGEPLLMS